jgi:hypothetical protein
MDNAIHDRGIEVTDRARRVHNKFSTDQEIIE